MNERILTLKNIIEVPRSAKFPSYIKDRCFMLGLEVDIETEKQWWWRETVRYKISGPESKVRGFYRQMELDIEAFNTPKPVGKL